MVTSYTVNALTDGVTYYFVVQAYDANRRFGPASNEVSGRGGSSTAPAAPTNLAAAVSGSSINLGWRAPGGTVTGYRIEVGTSPGQTNAGTFSTTATSHTLNGLAAGTYYIRVRAVNGTAVSLPSNEATATVSGSTTAPVPPLNLAAHVSGSTINLTWQPPSGTVTSYRVEAGTAPGQSQMGADSTTGTSYTITAFPPGTYYIRVRSVNAYGTSAPGNEVVATLGGSTGVQPPPNLTGSVANGTTINLAWQPASGTVTGYRVEVGSAAGQSNVRTSTVGAGVTTLSIADLRGGPFFIRVRTVNGTTTSNPSNEIQLLCAPASPSALAASVRRRRYVDLAWQPPSTGASSYAIEVGTSAGASNVRSVTTTATTYTFGDLANGTYFFRVRARNNAGLSSPGNEVQATVSRSSTSALSTTLTAEIRDTNTIDLSWSPDPAAELYRVEVGTATAQTDVSSFTTGPTTTFTIGDLPAQTYYIRVRGGGADGFDDPSEEVVVSLPTSGNVPQNLAASTDGNGMVHLTWAEPEGGAPAAATYLVEVGSAPGRSDLARVEVSGHELVSGPVPQGTYFVRVRALTGAGTGGASNEAVVHIGRGACAAPPPAPRLVTHVSGTSVELSWSSPGGEPATGYVLDIGTSPGRRDIATLTVNAETRTLTTQAAEGSYAVRLAAVNACGLSAWGAEATVTVGGAPIALPDAPLNLAHDVSGRAATLVWSAAASGGPARSYVIEVLDPTDHILLSLDTGNASTTFTHGDIPAGEYRVRVRGVNARGVGPASNTAVITIQ